MKKILANETPFIEIEIGTRFLLIKDVVDTSDFPSVLHVYIKGDIYHAFCSQKPLGKMSFNNEIWDGILYTPETKVIPLMSI
jgi:hypothetical protein